MLFFPVFFTDAVSPLELIQRPKKNFSFFNDEWRKKHLSMSKLCRYNLDSEVPVSFYYAQDVLQ